MHISLLPLSGPSAARSLEGPEMAKELADIALLRYKRYIDTILHQELLSDHALNSSWDASDHSRVNAGFRRYQLRGLADFMGVEVTSLAARGEEFPRVDGVNYTWNELYKHPTYKRFQQRAQELAKLYLQRSGYETDDIPKRFSVITWVEVFEKGDAYRPISHTDGAYVMGRFFAAFPSGAIKLQFEDVRGINPPYGKTHTLDPYQGAVVMYPSWASTFTTPSMASESVVTYCFLVFPADGTKRSWRDDLTAELEVRSVPRIRKTGK